MDRRFETGQSRATAEAAEHANGAQADAGDPWAKYREAGFIHNRPQEFITGRTPGGEEVTMRVGITAEINGGEIMHYPHPEDMGQVARVIPPGRKGFV